jgi:hypothetical protein
MNIDVEKMEQDIVTLGNLLNEAVSLSGYVTKNITKFGSLTFGDVTEFQRSDNDFYKKFVPQTEIEFFQLSLLQKNTSAHTQIHIKKITAQIKSLWEDIVQSLKNSNPLLNGLTSYSMTFKLSDSDEMKYKFTVDGIENKSDPSSYNVKSVISKIIQIIETSDLIFKTCPEDFQNSHKVWMIDTTSQLVSAPTAELAYLKFLHLKGDPNFMEEDSSGDRSPVIAEIPSQDKILDNLAYMKRLLKSENGKK